MYIRSDYQIFSLSSLLKYIQTSSIDNAFNYLPKLRFKLDLETSQKTVQISLVSLKNGLAQGN